MDEYYAPEDKCLWDAWFFQKGDEHHMFHLQTPWPEKREERHHDAVSIGRAVSKDLKTWTPLPDAILPGEEGEWDDLALWTGCAVEHNGTFFLFYTGRQKDEFYVQRIGVATSDDLINWQKHPANPILEHHPDHYHMDNSLNELDCVPAWRDPFVFKDPNSDKFFMTLSARTKGEETEYNACIALAESDNLLDWKVHPPILAPEIYDEMENTQVIFHNNLYYLFFCTHKKGYHPEHAAEHGAASGLHCYYSKSLFGPFAPVNKTGIVLDNGKHLYSVRLIHKKDNEFHAIGWLNSDNKGNLIARLAHPFTMIIDGDRVFRKEE
jgi:beta-fructofuranosidase